MVELDTLKMSAEFQKNVTIVSLGAFSYAWTFSKDLTFLLELWYFGIFCIKNYALGDAQAIEQGGKAEGTSLVNVQRVNT